MTDTKVIHTFDEVGNPNIPTSITILDESGEEHHLTLAIFTYGDKHWVVGYRPWSEEAMIHPADFVLTSRVETDSLASAIQDMQRILLMGGFISDPENL